VKKNQAIAVILVLVIQLAIQLAAVGITFAAHSATVVWVKPDSHHPWLRDDPSYPFMPGLPNEYFWNGTFAKWISFTVTNNGRDMIKEIKIVFQKYDNGSSMFDFGQTGQNKTGWYATPDEFGPDKRPTVLYFRTDSSSQYINAGETVTFSLFMTHGPEECRHNIDVWTMDAGSTPSTNFYELYILIDQHYPHVQNTDPADGTIFRDGSSVKMEAKATDSDGPHLSGIKNATLRIHYIVGPGKQPIPDYIHIMYYDSINDLYYLVLNQTAGQGLRDECWHNWTVTVFDYAENGPVTSKQTTFFWFIDKPPIGAWTIDPCFLKDKPVGRVGGNAHARASTGFKPDSASVPVTITFEGNGRVILLGTANSNHWGEVNLDFQVPETSRGRYKIVFTQPDPPNPPITNYTYFTIIPWVQIEKSNSTGPVGTPTMVNGTGFDASINIVVFYRDVSFGNPVQWDWTHEWSDRAFNFSWCPYLDNLSLNNPLDIITNVNGTFRLKFNVPESYGGYHPIFAQEWSPILGLLDVRSGWMNIPSTDPQPYPEKSYPEAAFFNVTTTVWTDRAIGLSGQYIKIYASGLPLPEYKSTTYNCSTGATTVDNHNWALALDFGQSNKYWVFEKSFLLNNEFDFAWYQQLYLPFAYWYNHTDPKSPTWNGQLYWKDYEGQNRLGSQFLEIPVIAPGNYIISLYQFDRQAHVDVYYYLSTTSFTVLKDSLSIRVSSGTLYFKGENVTVYAEIDLDGTATDPTDISFQLYHEEEFSSSLIANHVSTGLYTASFTCPSQNGNYFIKVNATKAFNGFVLSGFGTSSFAVSPTLDGLNATVTALSNGIATINTGIGTITLDLNDVKGIVTSINGNVATISTNIGKVQTDISTINGRLVQLDSIQTTVAGIDGKLVALSTNVATIQTDVGTIRTTLDNINAQIIAIGTDTVSIKTTVGDIQGKVTAISGSTVDIQTSIGHLSITAESIKTETGLQPTSIALSLMAAIAGIIAAILVFRKLYT
jgi:hypothetical protein